MERLAMSPASNAGAAACLCFKAFKFRTFDFWSTEVVRYGVANPGSLFLGDLCQFHPQKLGPGVTLQQGAMEIFLDLMQDIFTFLCTDHAAVQHVKYSEEAFHCNSGGDLIRVKLCVKPIQVATAACSPDGGDSADSTPHAPPPPSPALSPPQPQIPTLPIPIAGPSRPSGIDEGKIISLARKEHHPLQDSMLCQKTVEIEAAAARFSATLLAVSSLTEFLPFMDDILALCLCASGMSYTDHHLFTRFMLFVEGASTEDQNDFKEMIEKWFEWPAMRTNKLLAPFSRKMARLNDDTLDDCYIEQFSAMLHFNYGLLSRIFLLHLKTLKKPPKLELL